MKIFQVVAVVKIVENSFENGAIIIRDLLETYHNFNTAGELKW